MNTVTQKMMFRQSLIKYSMKYGVTKKRRYDGTLQSPSGVLFNISY